MPSSLLSINEPNLQWPTEPIFLDPTCADALYGWSVENWQRLPWLKSAPIEMLAHHFDLLPHNMQRWFKGREKVFTISSVKIGTSEMWMVDELLRLQFGGDPAKRARAETLVLARKRRGNTHISFFTQCQLLAQTPNSTTYYCPLLEDLPLFPLNFEPFRDLDFHHRLGAVAQTAFDSGLFPIAIEETVKAIEAEVAAKHSCGQSGAQLMKDAFACTDSRNNASNRVAPRLPLNRWNLSDSANSGTESERNEAIGLASFFAGIHPALRNPTAHATHDNVWLQSRFGDARRTLKWLGFLSVLMEILDKPYKT